MKFTRYANCFLASIYFASSLLSHSNSDVSYTLNIFSSSTMYQDFAPFVDNILRQTPSQQLYSAVTQNLDLKSFTSDKQLYATLLTLVPSIQPSYSLYHKIKSLNHQKKILTDQAYKLLGNCTYEHCVEIGTPCTYSNELKSKGIIVGTLYSAHDREEYSDYLQSFSFNPFKKFRGYDVFVPLNNYDPLDQSALPDQSVELIICFIGLHHIPTEKLDAFISSLSRILKPGGILLLRDHNAHKDVLPIVHAAHTVFNALMTNAPLSEEIKEYRNFQRLDYWITLLEKHGFSKDSRELLQEGDPTLNTMMSFTRLAKNPQEEQSAFSFNLKKTIPGYTRPAYQGDMTAPEWINVDASQEYAAFLNHTPFFEFPYWENIKTYWKVFGESYKLARTKESCTSVLTSSYFLMNLFIGCTMTAEYATKSLISLPLRLMYQGQEDQHIHIIISGPEQELISLDPRIAIVDHSYDHQLIVIKIPRYKEFFEIIRKINAQNFIIHEIAGQKEIQLKVRYRIGNNLLAKNRTDAYIHRYSWTLPTQQGYTYSVITSPCKLLLTNIAWLENNDIEVLYVHDF